MCATCSFAIGCVSLAQTPQAVDKAVEGYRAHLLRDHGFSQSAAMGQAETFRLLAPKLGEAYVWRSEEPASGHCWSCHISTPTHDGRCMNCGAVK